MSALAGLSRGDLLRALAVVVIWGLNFVVMKVGLQGLGPMLLGALRFAAAALPFLLFVKFPRLPLRYVAGYGLAQGLGQFGFLFLGLQLGMTAGMASVVMQTQAFFTLLLEHPGSPLRAALDSDLLRRAGIGLAMTVTALVVTQLAGRTPYVLPSARVVPVPARRGSRRARQVGSRVPRAR